jgi:prevent-host-death family protein
MITVNLKEARQRLGQLVAAAEHGESVVIVRRGKEVARLTAITSGPRRQLPDMSAFRDSIQVQGKPLSESIIDARRDERY